MTTIKELIEQLKKYPEDMRVVTQCVNSNIDGVWRDFDGIETGILNRKEHFGLYTGYTEEEAKENFSSVEEWETEKVAVFVCRR